MANFNIVSSAAVELDSGRLVDLVSTAGATANGGTYRVQMWTPDDTVYIGGASLSEGSSNGFLLLPNTLYTLETLYVSAGGEDQLFGTSTATAPPGDTLYVLLQLLFGS